MSRIFLVAGEASGDLHGSLLAHALRHDDPTIEIAGVGGSAMEAAGVRLVHRSEEMGVTGFWEVLRHLPRMRRILGEVEAKLLEFKPDLFVPIDYPDFNLRLGEKVHRAGIPIVYYISPQVWAWRRGRLKQLARLVQRMIVIFPFEEHLYRSAGIPVSYVGHPFVDRVKPQRERREQRRRLGIADGEHLVVLLPGSRASEVGRILPLFLQTRQLLASVRRDLRWVVAQAPGLSDEAIAEHLGDDDRPTVCVGATYDLVAAADLVLTASGTATLEAALLGAPMIVVYKMHPLTWRLARLLVRVPHVAMANLLAGERIVPEFLQDDARPKNLAAEVVAWIDDPQRRERTSAALRRLVNALGEGGAPQRAARLLLEEIAR